MTNLGAPSKTWSREPFIENRTLRYSIYAGVIIYLFFSINSLEINWIRVWEGLPRGKKFLTGFAPPDFFSRWEEIVDGVLESLWMTVASTVVGIFISIPVALGAAKNIAHPLVYYFCRGIIAISRSFHEILLAIFFVKFFGFGPFAGFITLSFATIGFFAKLLTEDIEDTNVNQSEAIQATGANWWQWINYGIQPQVMPRMIGLGLYRFDINFRESAIVGVVGGGGIGATLNTAFDRYEFDSAAAILVVIIAIVFCVEYTSGIVRKKVQ